jgi:hypothetical protein
MTNTTNGHSIDWEAATSSSPEALFASRRAFASTRFGSTLLIIIVIRVAFGIILRVISFVVIPVELVRNHETDPAAFVAGIGHRRPT